jgi:uncharacterized protein (DUF1800 family)
MGLPIPPRGGIRDGEQVAQMLARHPSTAMHIAEKLCRRFVSDTPPAALTSRVAAAFSGSSGDIKTTLRALFGSPEFAASTGAKTQRPFELLASAVRALDTHPADTVTPDKMTATLSRQLTQMGQPLFGWQPPNGYPDAAAAWINTSALLARWNYAIALAENRIPEARYDVQDLLPPTARTAGQIVTALARRVLNTQIAPAHYSALVHYLVPKGNAFSTPDPRTLSRRLLELVGLLINSPYFQRR